jgi:phenylacetate-CoA ligase
LDANAGVERRTRTWQAALESGDVCAADRVLLALPLDWAVARDAHLALQELGALTMVAEHASLADVFAFAPTVLVGTLTDALGLAHAAAAERIDLAESSVRLVVITAEPGASLDVTRRAIEDRWGAACLDVYATSELGALGWGCSRQRDGIHLDGELEFAVLAPEADQQVADGELGELAVTTPATWDPPLTRFRTGDLVRLRRDFCDCGRGSAWIEGGVLGRVDELLVVRGNTLLPAIVEQVARRHPAVIDYGLRAYTVRDQCEVAVEIEVNPVISSEGDRARVAAEVAEDLRRSLGLRLQCEVAPPASLSKAHLAGRRASRLSRQ